MDRFPFLNVLKEFVGILNESRKLFLKNKKLMFSVFVFPLLLKGLVYLFNVLAFKSEITNLIEEANLLPMMDPSSPEYIVQLMKIFADFRQFVASSYIFSAISFIINLLSILVIVHASAITYKDENVKIKDFPVLTLKSWKGPLVTYFYISLFSLGYWLLFFITLFPLLVLSNFTFLAAKSCILLVLFALFQSYLAIVWYLSLVISILEETYGIQALGKAAKIVKGMKPKLFLVNLFFGLLSFGLAQIVRVVDLRWSFAVTLTTGLVLVVGSIFVVTMFLLTTYTVAYFQCTSLHGQDVESLRDVEYTKLPSTSLIGALP